MMGIFKNTTFLMVIGLGVVTLYAKGRIVSLEHTITKGEEKLATVTSELTAMKSKIKAQAVTMDALKAANDDCVNQRAAKDQQIKEAIESHNKNIQQLNKDHETELKKIKPTVCGNTSVPVDVIDYSMHKTN